MIAYAGILYPALMKIYRNIDILLCFICYLCSLITRIPDMDNRKFEKVSRALSDASRIFILQQLKKKKGCLYCAEITEMLELTQPSVSHHLKQLVEADLLIPEKEGRNLKYILNQKVLNDYIDRLNALKE